MSYIKAHGGRVERTGTSWDLTWPDGETYANVVFTSKDAEKLPATRYLTLEESRVRGLVMRLPRFAPGQPIPVVTIPGIAEEIKGIWSLWRVAIATKEWNRQRIIPLFLSDNGKTYIPTAKHIWDQLLAVSPQVLSYLDAELSRIVFARSQKAAEEHGRSIYEALVQEHQTRITREREKAEYAFITRRRTTERIGLPQVRNYRLNILAQEEQVSKEELDKKALAYPEMMPLLILRVESSA